MAPSTNNNAGSSEYAVLNSFGQKNENTRTSSPSSGRKKLRGTDAVDLDMNYLGPGAFTVLPLDPEKLPSPSPAPPLYRLTPTTRRQKHKSFAIIGDPTSSSSNSRSSSPSGRVSPFKGRGFNPIGSRHASPSISPIPPEDPRAISPRCGALPSLGGTSRIPKLTVGSKPRKSSTGAVFGEKVSHVNFKGLSRQSSRSLTSLEEKNVRRRPPPSPRKKLKGPQAFKHLSPIEGSSPEPSQSLSSPSRIPTKSKSTPPSRLTSPTRERSRATTRSQSRSNLIQSRDHSPLAVPTKIPVKRYEHVQSKINSFNNKPKIPPKPHIPPTSSDLSEDSESPRKKVLTRRNSINRTTSRPNLLPKTYMGKNQNYTSDSSLSTEPVDSHKPKTVSAKTFGPKVNTKNVLNATSVVKGSSSAAKTNSNKASVLKTNQTPKNSNKKDPSTPSAVRKATKENEIISADVAPHMDDDRKNTSSVRGSKLDLTHLDLDNSIPSTMDVVSSTTTTVTKPLKIDTPKLGRAHEVSPMIDGRVLSATSVSHAINKMNDTVLNSQTLIKDSGLQSRLGSAAGAVISVRSEGNEKKGGIYEENEKASPKNSEVFKAKEDQSKKVDNQSSIKPSEGVVTTKSDGKTESPGAVSDKTAKMNLNNINVHYSSITEPASKGMDSQNNSRINPSVPAAVNNSTNHFSNNHSNNHVTTVGLGNARAIEREVQNNMSRLLGSMDSSLGDTPVNKLSANDRIREARTVIASDVKPIRITVREKPSEVEVQSGNVGPHFSIANGVSERPGLPPHQQSPPNEPAKEEPPPNRCKRFINSCTKALTCNKCQSCRKTPNVQELQEEVEKTGCFKCLEKKSSKGPNREQVRINIEGETKQEKKTVWEKLKCCNRNRVGDTQSCFPLGKRKESWVERRAGSFLESEVQQRTKCCSKLGCKNFFRKIFCCCFKKKEEAPLPMARKESMISSKKKSLTPTTLPPPEDTRPKIDISLVEHTSHMKGAIPVLPVWLAWFCCVMNCFGPGTGTVLSGLFCLCIGKPRFSQKDGPKPRIGSFIINLIIGFSQFFTVLFCLVGWGWSIWWGVIMVKVAKKHKRFKHLEHLEEVAARPQPLAGHQKRDAERGRM